MKQFIFLSAIAVHLIFSPAYAADYRISSEGRFGCTDKDYFKKIVTIAAQEGREGFAKALLLGVATKNCTMFEDKESIYLMDRSLLMVKVRREGEQAEYWTNRESIK